MIWQLSRSSRVRLGFGFERETAVSAFPSLSRSPTEEEEGSDMRDPLVSGSGEWLGAWAGARSWAETGSPGGRGNRRRLGRSRGESGPKREKAAQKRFYSFSFSYEFKSKFKFKIQAKTLQINSQKSNKNLICLIQHECKIFTYILCHFYLLSYKIGFLSLKIFKLILNLSNIEKI